MKKQVMAAESIHIYVRYNVDVNSKADKKTACVKDKHSSNVIQLNLSHFL